MSIKSQVWKTKPHSSSQSLSVTLDAFHDKSGIKKGLCSRTFYVGDYKLIIQGVLCQSYYRNPLNTEVSAVVMLHHMALLADHANGRIRRERVFRDHTDLLVAYIQICTFMSDQFFFNSGTVRSVLLTEFTAAATCCHSLCFLLLAIPIP